MAHFSNYNLTAIITLKFQDHKKMEVEGLVRGYIIEAGITLVGVLRFEALIEPAPTLVVSNFLITDAVNLLISLMSANLSDMWRDLAFDLFFSAEPSEGLLFNGVAILSLFDLEVPIPFKHLNEKTGAFFLPIDCKTSWSKLEPCCNNNYYCVSPMFSND